ncbi:MAG: 50S ribosomal protein L4 [bacterium]|nr:50S ribosomal protein L4 [bacterium]
MESKVYNIQGKEVRKVQVPENLFGVKWNADLLHQVVVAMQANARTPVAHTKDRGEVRGGGRKPWKQKGTGRARHGSTRSPLWRGGGITFGPRNDKSYAQKINRQQKQKALLVALSRKYKDGEVLFVEALEMQTPKTAAAQAVIAGLGKAGFAFTKKRNAALFALPSAHYPTMKSFANIGNVATDDVRNLNPVNVLSSTYLVIANPEVAFAVLSKKRVVKTESK